MHFVLLSGAGQGTYENIITGLAADPDVSSWTVTTSGFGGSTFTYDSGNVHLNLVPEPSSAMLLATAFLGLFLMRKRRA